MIVDQCDAVSAVSRDEGIMSVDAEHVDRALDETLEETFPASDAPANTPETGVVLPPAGTEKEVAPELPSIRLPE